MTRFAFALKCGTPGSPPVVASAAGAAHDS